MSDAGRQRANFNPVAAIYRWAEYAALGPLLQRTRTHWLPQVTGCRRVLLLGDGDGRFLEQLLLANATCQALAVDSSAAMLARLRRRCLANPAANAAGRLETLEADALDIYPSPETDLIVTHFVLDCFSQGDLERLVHTLAAPLAPGVLWLISDFDLPPQPVLRLLARTYIRALYLAFRALTGLRVRSLPDPQRALTSAGFQRLHRWQMLGGFLYSELWRLESAPSSAPQHNFSATSLLRDTSISI